MNILFFYGIHFLKNIVSMSIVASVLIFIVLIVNRLFRKKLSPRLQYILWLLVLIRLIVPLAPKSSLSVFNIIPFDTQNILKAQNTIPNYFINESLNADTTPSSSNNEKLLISDDSNKTSEKIVLSLLNFIEKFYLSIIFVIWFLVTLISIAYILISQIQLIKKFNKVSQIDNKLILNTLHECTLAMKLNKKVSIIFSEDIKSPALFGYFNPKIILPKNIMEKISSVELKYVFFHELSHLKRKDTLVNWLMSLLSIIYWFNPVILFGFYKMRESRELACDSLALTYANDNDFKAYGATIIDLLKSSNMVPQPLGMTDMLRTKSQIKRRITMIKLFTKNSYKLSAATMGILVLFCLVVLTDAKASTSNLTDSNTTQKQIVFDKIDYPFIDDENALGKWRTVDFVKDIDQFNPDKKWWGGSLFLKEMSFLKSGKMVQPWWTWTNGYVINNEQKTASEYVVKEIKGSTYLFFQWKNGDYIYRNETPYYYVLKKDLNAQETQNPNTFVPERKTDNIDFSFENDSKLIGKWESIDFVTKVNEFEPKNKKFNESLYLKGMTFLENGKTADSWWTWTKGHILHQGDKTDSSYEIKEIQGVNYLFFQWKSGDYIFGNMEPQYYVLRKLNN